MCLKRATMPQIAAEDATGLAAYLRAHGVTVTYHCDMPLGSMDCVQCLNETRVRPVTAMLHSLEHKPPLWISGENKIIDGNHRWAIWQNEGLHSAPVYKVHTGHHEAISHINHYHQVRFNT